jgi:hypothetical protein
MTDAFDPDKPIRMESKISQDAMREIGFLFISAAATEIRLGPQLRKDLAGLPVPERFHQELFAMR